MSFASLIHHEWVGWRATKSTSLILSHHRSTYVSISSQNEPKSSFIRSFRIPTWLHPPPCLLLHVIRGPYLSPLSVTFPLPSSRITNYVPRIYSLFSLYIHLLYSTSPLINNNNNSLWLLSGQCRGEWKSTSLQDNNNNGEIMVKLSIFFSPDGWDSVRFIDCRERWSSMQWNDDGKWTKWNGTLTTTVW